MPSPIVESLSFETFQRSETAWNELLVRSSAPGPFLLHSWLCTWWRHFGDGLEFVALLVRDDSGWLAAVPLALRRVGLGLTVAELVGTGPVPTRGIGLADKADLLVRVDAEQAREHLCNGLIGLLDRVDVLDLKGFDAASPTLREVARLAPEPFRGRSLPHSVSPYLALTGSWDDYLSTRSGNFRKHLRKYRRQLDTLGAWSVERFGNDGDVGTWLREVQEVNAASWKARRGTNLFRHPKIREFLLDLTGQMAERGELDLQLLRVEGRAIAYELCFDCAGRMSSYNSGFRPEHFRSSPGTLLTAAVIESACARGRTEYDMLRGAEEYKTRWSETLRREAQLILPAGRLRSRLYAQLGIHGKQRLKRVGWLAELADRVSGLSTRVRH